MFWAVSIREMATPVPIMKGGVQEHISDLFMKYQLPIEALSVIILVTTVVFLEKVPLSIRNQANTLLGKSFLLSLTVFITFVCGWPLGLLTGITVALLVGAGRVVKEGFAPDMSVRIISDKHKWFSEKVLGENPLLIEDQTVSTTAVQDLSERNSGSVQSSSVSH